MARGNMRRKFYDDVISLMIDGVARDKKDILKGINYNYKDFTNSMSYLQMNLAERTFKHELIKKGHTLKATKVGRLYLYQLILR